MLLRKFSDCFHALVKATYDYMLNLASRRNAMYFLFAVAFIESSFFPIPPDVMLIPMVLAAPAKAWRIAGIATAASVLGGAFGYAIGVFFFDLIARPILTFYGYIHQFDVFKDNYHCQRCGSFGFCRLYAGFGRCARHALLSGGLAVEEIRRTDERLHREKSGYAVRFVFVASVGRFCLYKVSLGQNKTPYPGFYLVFVAESNASFGQVVRRHFNIDLVADHDADAKLAHFSGRMGQNFDAVFQSDSEHGIRQFLDDIAGQFKQFFFTHKIFLISFANDFLPV